MTRFWEWFIITLPRRCVICGGKLSGGQSAVKAHYRGEITLCRWCREALDEADRLTYSAMGKETPELFEAFDSATTSKKHNSRKGST